MANLIPTQNALSIPPDASLAAGLPVAGSTIRHLAQTQRWAYEAITGGIVPGESAAALAGTGEFDLPHDHSGRVGGYDHGVYRGISGTAIFQKPLCAPFDAWPAGWAADQNGFSVSQVGDSHADWDAKYGYNWWILDFTMVEELDTDIAFGGYARVRIPRGTSGITVQHHAFQYDFDSDLTPGYIWWAVLATDGTLVDSASEALDQTETPETRGYDYDITVTLDVASTGAPLDADTDVWLAFGLQASGSGVGRKMHVAATSCNYYTIQA